MIAELAYIHVVVFLFGFFVSFVMNCEVSKIVSVLLDRHNL